ncbi:MAG TPA: vitamin B12 dependent-methionine synthase activation domain-containing protein, partial [Candidatus Sumerlaeota bacterium]|nr:vitamin B12 dependent-methionine synthase activation domain-containing protein [Candidatus Sumerlaeota bacterium]
LTKFHTLRQQQDKQGEGQHNYALADFIAPVESGRADYIGAFAVTSGGGLDEFVAHFQALNDDYNKIMAQALADRLAEAFAELLHKKAREVFEFGTMENLTNEQLIREEYRGIRPAPGYPACPDHTEKRTLFNLLDVENNTGIHLTESCAMTPGSSVSGLYFAHPRSKYFGISKINRDQVLDYQTRKGMPLEEIEQWLAPWLAYEPSSQSAKPAES